MAKYYSDENIRRLADERANLRWRGLQLQQRCLEYHFKNETAKEFAIQGFARRFSTLIKCIENTFCTIPPDLDGVPGLDQTKDVAIQVRAFIFNLFGCLDNLTWVWVLERNITKPDGTPLPPRSIGFDVTSVRNSLTQELRTLLDSFSDWFKYLKDYRHALAHRIPLYVPQFSIDHKSVDIYGDLERSIFDLIIQRNKAEAQVKRLEHDNLRFFQPCIVHSWTGRARPILFHVQMLTDLKTIEIIGAKLLDELPRPSQTSEP
jgi:hypothetical protein